MSAVETNTPRHTIPPSSKTLELYLDQLDNREQDILDRISAENEGLAPETPADYRDDLLQVRRAKRLFKRINRQRAAKRWRALWHRARFPLFAFSSGVLVLAAGAIAGFSPWTLVVLAGLTFSSVAIAAAISTPTTQS